MIKFRGWTVLLVIPILIVTVFLAMQIAEGWQAVDAPMDDTAMSDNSIVAEVGERKILLRELDQLALQLDAGDFQGMQLKQALYEARRQSLDRLIAEQLLDAEAASRGITRNQLVSDEITSKIQSVTEADVELWYNQNRQRVGEATVDQVRDQISALLQQEKNIQAGRSFVERLRAEGNILMLLEPPRTEVRVAANDPTMGPEGAPIQIIEFSDFQ